MSRRPFDKLLQPAAYFYILKLIKTFKLVSSSILKVYFAGSKNLKLTKPII